MNYEEALNYIYELNTGIPDEISLREIKELSHRMENPEKKLRVIHIAGTNGKGSVGTYIANILAMSGYTVGRYVSPALFEYREIIQKITGSMYGLHKEFISESEVADILTVIREKCEQMTAENMNHPSVFEMETVMAFEAMRRWHVDVAVIETGMGGLNDATNIVEKPVMSVITSISMDHMHYLGDTLLDISKQKFGIVKKGCPVVSVMHDDECMEELKTVCHEKASTLYVVNAYDVRPYEFSINKTSFEYFGDKYSLGQGGIFQFENAALALKAAEVLQLKGFHLINIQSVKEALLNSRWQGRFELVSNSPYVIVDGAHNPSAAKALKYSLNAYFPGEKFNLVMGVFKDKDYESILRTMLPCAAHLYTITAPGERGLDAAELAETAEKIAAGRVKDIQVKPNIKSALSTIFSGQFPGKTVVFGSLSFLHEVYEYFGR